MYVSEFKKSFVQNPDTCDPNTESQVFEIFTEDGGGGPYIVISTKRWAIDIDDIGEFLDKMIKPFIRDIERDLELVGDPNKS